MKHEAEFLYQQIDENFASKFVPLISFKDIKQKKIAEKYIWEQVDIFFNKLGVDLNETLPISSSQLITEIDFDNSKNNEYFYKNIFNTLERNKVNEKLKFKIKWCITFDKNCAPIELKFTNKPKGFGHVPDREFSSIRSYGTIDIAGKPIFYYIYFTFQEILDKIKGT